MASLNKKNVRIQYTFELETSQGWVRSALYFTPSEYEALSDEEVSTRAEVQATAWEQNVIAAKAEEAKEYTPEELLKLKEELEAQIVELQAQKVEIETALNVA